jgi:hypothetical protein
MIDHGGNKQRQTHLTGTDYHGIHGVYDSSASRKFAAEK